jgi:para-nitrobenzyl esterase
VPGDACPQRDKADGDGYDEDCLFLNVYAPVSTLNNPSARLPVLFWIHGGAYKSGSSNAYFGDNIVGASGNSVLVVTINYRLNIFGFLGGRQVSASTRGAGSGNFGIMDQRLALQWVKQHIGAFGGDSNSVTIFGESAGGNSVINHLAQPASFGLYQRAIVQSGTYNEGAQNMSIAEASLSAVLANLDCSDLTCLRAKDATTIESAASSMTFTGPIVDGISLMDTPAALIGQKRYNSEAPVLVGSNRDENAFFTLAQRFPPNMTEAQMESLFVENYGISQAKIAQIKATYAFPATTDAAAQRADQYPYPKQLGSYSKWYWMYMRAATDTVPGLGACGVRWMNRLLVAGGTPEVYSYLFAHPPEEKLGIPGGGGGIFAPHTSEIAFVYAIPVPALTVEEAVLARQMCQHWLAFAKTGSPNFSGAPTWPAWTPTGTGADTVMRLDVPSAGGTHVQQGLRKAACDLQDTFSHHGM